MEQAAEGTRKLIAELGGLVGGACRGFGTFADRPVGSADVAFRKLAALAHASRILRR